MPNVIPINDPYHPVKLALATGRVDSAQAEVFMDIHDERPDAILSVLSTVPANSIKTKKASWAQYAEISNHARQKGITFAEAHRDLHKVARELAYTFSRTHGPEAA